MENENSTHVIPMAKFNTGITIAGGIGMNALFIGFILTAALVMALQNILSFIPLVILAGLLGWYVFIPFGEWVTDVIPPKYFQHILDWLIQGDAMYITNDSSPIPLVMEPSSERKERDQEIKENRGMLNTSWVETD